MKYGSVCSGIEAASVAWAPLGWEALWFSEIEAFPCAVLEHRWPGVPNLGDMTRLHENEKFNDSAIDLLVAGTPCQSFSVAGLRGGLDDPRGNLTLHLLKLLDCKRPRWFVWENVPGVFSSWSDTADDFPLSGPDDPPRYGAVVQGNDFDTFIHGLEALGYGVAWRLFDAQYFYLAQRRARPFVVGYLGDWRPAAAVLFERHGLSGDPPPSRAKGKEVAGTHGGGSGKRGFCDDLDRSGAFIVKGAAIGRKPENGPQRGEILADGSCFALNTRETHAVAFNPRQDPDVSGDISHPIGAMDKGGAIAYDIHLPLAVALRGRDGGNMAELGDEVSNSLRGCDGGSSHAHVLCSEIAPSVTASGPPFSRTGNEHVEAEALVAQKMAVRRLTPKECERLQGFPDDYTLIPYRNRPAELCPDGPRYKALGNSMAVPVMRWIGERIEMVDAMVNQELVKT